MNRTKHQKRLPQHRCSSFLLVVASFIYHCQRNKYGCRHRYNIIFYNDIHFSDFPFNSHLCLASFLIHRSLSPRRFSRSQRGCDLWVGYRIARGLVGQTRSWWGAFLFFGWLNFRWSWGMRLMRLWSHVNLYQDCLLFCFFSFVLGWGGVGELYGCHSISLPVLWFLFLGMSLDRSWPDLGIWVLGSQI